MMPRVGLRSISFLTSMPLGLTLGFLLLSGCRSGNRAAVIEPATLPNVQLHAATDGGRPTGGELALAERYRRRAGPDGTIPPNALMIAKAHSNQMPILEIESPSDGDLAVPRDAGIWTWDWLGPGNIGGRIRSILIHPTNTDHMWIGGVAGGIWQTTDGGASWSPINDFLASLAVSCMAMHPSNPDIMFAGTGEASGSGAGLGAGLFKSIDGGQSWGQVEDTIPSKVSDDWSLINRLAFSADGQTLLATTPKTVFRSTEADGPIGTDWQSVQSIQGPGTFRDVKFHPSDPTQALVTNFTCTPPPTITCTASVLLSTDSGQTWTTTATWSNATRVELAWSPSNTTRIYASVNVNGGEVWRSTDGGQSFALRNTGTNYFLTGNGNSQGDYDNALWVDPTSSDIIVVGGIDLWRSSNGGTNLESISSWPFYHGGGGSAHADQHFIVEHPSYSSSNRRVYVANDGGIQTTTNIRTAGTFDWTNLANDLGITQFYAGAVSPDGSVLLGGAQDNSFLRFDAGTTWVQPTTGDGGFCAVDHQNTSLRYASTQNLNILRAGIGDIYLPQHNGLTDTQQPGRTLFIAPFAMAPTNSSRLIAGGADIWRTSNGGGDWESIRGDFDFDCDGDGTNDCFELCSAIAFRANNSNNVWVGYNSGRISRTAEAFTVASPAWTDVDGNAPGLPNEFVTSIAISSANANHVFVTFGTYGSNTIVWLTEDNGLTWLNRSGSGSAALPEVGANSITFHPNNSNWVYVGTDLGVYASEDRGQTWSQTPRFGNPADPSGHEGPVNTEVAQLFWDNQGRLYAATHGRGMYRARPLDTVFVDWTNSSGNEDGSFEFPFNTVQEGINAAGNGTTLSIDAGDYDESGTTVFDRRLRIVTTGLPDSSVIIR